MAAGDSARRRGSSNSDADSNECSDKVEIKYLKEQLKIKDEKIAKLTNIIENLQKIKLCSVPLEKYEVATTAADRGEGSVVGAVGLTPEQTKVCVNMNLDQGGMIADDKTEYLETKVNNLENSMNDRFTKLEKLITAGQNKQPSYSNILQQGNTPDLAATSRSPPRDTYQQQDGENTRPAQARGTDASQGRRETTNNMYDANLNRMREERRNNIIIFKLPEVEASSDEQWIVDEIFKEMDVEYLSSRIEWSRVTRLGMEGSRMRPLRVPFKSYMDRETAVRKGYKLKSTKYEGVGVIRDLIIADRIAEREKYMRTRQQYSGTRSGTPGQIAAAPVPAEEPAMEPLIETAATVTVPAEQTSTTELANSGLQVNDQPTEMGNTHPRQETQEEWT